MYQFVFSQSICSYDTRDKITFNRQKIMFFCRLFSEYSCQQKIILVFQNLVTRPTSVAYLIEHQSVNLNDLCSVRFPASSLADLPIFLICLERNEKKKIIVYCNIAILRPNIFFYRFLHTLKKLLGI